MPLTHPVRQVTSTNKLAAGRELFLLTCSRCHTTDGINGVSAKLTGLLGTRPWPVTRLTAFIGGMHLTRTYMPPFPGSPAEAEALAVYLRTLQPKTAQQAMMAATNPEALHD